MKVSPRHIAAFDDIVSQKDAMKKLGLSDEWFRRKRKEGVITGTPLSNNRNWVYSKTELASYLKITLS